MYKLMIRLKSKARIPYLPVKAEINLAMPEPSFTYCGKTVLYEYEDLIELTRRIKADENITDIHCLMAEEK